MSARAFNVIAFTALASCLTGCQPIVYVMATSPVQIGAASAAVGPVDDSGVLMTLFYATTREPLGVAGSLRYGENAGDELRFGVATLRVDEGSASVDEGRALWSLSSMHDRPTPRLENLEERAVFGAGADLDALPAATARFLSDLDQALSASVDKDIFVYVHGAMNSVYRTAAQAAEYRELTERGSVVVAFVWPTVDNYPNYIADVRNARRSVSAFVRFIELLARHTHPHHINILAHSAGARIVSSALATLGKAAEAAEREGLGERLRLGEVYYSAADIEIREFVRDLKYYAHLPLRVTLQANREDYVLALLGLLPGSSRAGRLNLDELDVAGRESLRHWASESRLDIVDVTSEGAGNLLSRGHAFWYERRWVTSDVLLEFMYHAPPQTRGLQATEEGGVRRWVFPTDYEERAATATQYLHAH